MTEDQIRELVAKMRRAADRKKTDMLYMEEIGEAADVIEALAAPVDDAEYKLAENAYHDAECDEEFQSKLWGSLQEARQARLARIRSKAQ